MKRVNPVDLLAGLFVVTIGVVAIIEALQFNLGSARAMGPGYFPFYIGVLMICLGLVIIIVGGFFNRNAILEFPALRSLLFITAGIFCFSLLIERIGLVVAVAVAVFIVTFADRPFKLRRSLVLATVIPVICVLIFQMALGLQLQAFRWD